MAKIPRFASLDQAKQYFENDPDISSKYGVLYCYINGRYSCLMGTAMVEDELTRGPIEEVIRAFLEDSAVQGDIEYTTLYCGAELTGKLYDLLEEMNVLDVHFVYDEF